MQLDALFKAWETSHTGTAEIIQGNEELEPKPLHGALRSLSTNGEREASKADREAAARGEGSKGSRATPPVCAIKADATVTCWDPEPQDSLLLRCLQSRVFAGPVCSLCHLKLP